MGKSAAAAIFHLLDVLLISTAVRGQTLHLLGPLLHLWMPVESVASAQSRISPFAETNMCCVTDTCRHMQHAQAHAFVPCPHPGWGREPRPCLALDGAPAFILLTSHSTRMTRQNHADADKVLTLLAGRAIEAGAEPQHRQAAAEAIANLNASLALAGQARAASTNAV